MTDATSGIEAPATQSGLAGAKIIDTGDAEAAVIVTGSREQLFHLLSEAAEIEHSLMCSYLYAAFSLRRDGEGLTSAQHEAVTRWRSAIVSVAVEEMGHLVILANLATAIGARPHFSRPNFPVSSGYFPCGVVVELAKFSVETLEHFIFLERPKGYGDEDAACYAQDEYSRRQVHLGLMPNAQHYASIGFLYEAIRENLIGLCKTLGEEQLFCATGTMQLAPPVIDLPGVEHIKGLKEALAGIELIVEQGEGSSRDREDTHYRTFTAIRDELAEMTSLDPTFEPAWPAGDNPVLRSPPEPENKLFIENPEAASLLDFSCAAYGLLLRLLLQCFGDLPQGDEARQSSYFAAALGLMHVMGDCASALAKLPAAADGEGNAGMSFTMLRGLEPLLPGTIGEQLLSEQLKLLKLGAGSCEAVPLPARERLAGISL